MVTAFISDHILLPRREPADLLAERDDTIWLERLSFGDPREHGGLNGGTRGLSLDRDPRRRLGPGDPRWRFRC